MTVPAAVEPHWISQPSEEVPGYAVQSAVIASEPAVAPEPWQPTAEPVTAASYSTPEAFAAPIPSGVEPVPAMNGHAPLEPVVETSAPPADPYAPAYAAPLPPVAPPPSVRELSAAEFAAATGSLPASAVPQGVTAATVEGEPLAAEPGAKTGHPNWMLAFVSFWAGITAAGEAWATAQPAFKLSLMMKAEFLGYALLAGGLFGFAVEAVQWGRRRSASTWTLWVIIPALLTLLGVVFLIRSHDPGRRI